MGAKRSNVNLAPALKSIAMPIDPEEGDAFVYAEKQGNSNDAKTSKRQDVKAVKRRMTVYLPEELAKELELFCVHQGDAVSLAIEKAVRAHLKRHAPK